MTEIIASWSELDSMRQCYHKHDLQYRQRWQSPETSPALAKGTLMHSCLERHYRIRKDQPILGREVIFDMVRSAFLYQDDHTQTEIQNLVEWMYKGYLERWWDQDKHWEILGVEHEIVSPWLPTPGGGRSSFKIKMKMDLIVRGYMGPKKRLLLVDHKSGQNLPTERELELDDQFGLYQWGLRKMKRPAFATIYNAIRTQRNKGPMLLDDRFTRVPLYRTPDEEERIAIEAYQSLKRGYSTPSGYAERNPDSSANSHCKYRCPFLSSCLLGRKTSWDKEKGMMLDLGFVQDRTRH